MPRLKATIEYDGTNFCGMQAQQDQSTIQGEIENALSIILKTPTPINYAGRTDAGVHALGQVVSFDVDDNFYNIKNNTLPNQVKIIDIKATQTDMQSIQNGNKQYNRAQNAILNGVNFFLAQKGIVFVDICQVEHDFDPRKWAVERTYIYKILNRRSPAVIDFNRKWHVPFNLNIIKMKAAASFFIGKYDFTSFRSKECTAPNPIRSVNSITITQNSDDIYIEISARSFLHKMVRNIVGTLVEVAKNDNIEPSIVTKIIEAKDRSSAFVTAPPHGLYFKQVKY